MCGETDLVSKVLNNECAVGHAWLLKEGTRLQVGVVQFLSPGVVRTFRHLEKTWEKSQQLLENKKRGTVCFKTHRETRTREYFKGCEVLQKCCVAVLTLYRYLTPSFGCSDVGFLFSQH